MTESLRKKTLLYMVAVLLCLVGAARAQNPVSLSMSVVPAEVTAGGKVTARISASISGNWHMYSITQGAGGPIPTRITVADSPVFKAAGSPRGSAPKREMDPNFGIETEFYAGSASFTLPVSVNAGAAPGSETLTVNVRYQVCNETLCLPPRTLKVSSVVGILPAKPNASATASPSPTPTPAPSPSGTPTPSPSPTPETGLNTDEAAPSDPAAETTGSDPPGSAAVPSNQSMAGRDVGQEALWSFLWLAIATGAISLLTPCVFPMIPITVSYFTNHAAGHRGLAIRDALLYALGIIFTFTAIGVTLAVVLGAAGINNFASSPYVNIAIAAIFIAFALSLFGAYELGIPSSVMTRVDAFARGKESSRIVGVLLMGFVFSLTSFTCTAPFVGSLLVLAAAGDWLYPIIGMLAFSTVFALPFFVLALAPQLVAQLPRSGGWLNSIKVVMGFLEIAAAMKFISNVDLVLHWGIFTREVVLASWVAIALMITLYLLGLFQLSLDSKPERLGAVRVMCAFLFLSLSCYLLTGLFGARLGELESFLPIATEQSTAGLNSSPSTKSEAEWMKNDYEGALAKAKSEGKSVFIDFTGYTCTNCRWMEANMFPRPEVAAEMGRFVKVQLFTDGDGEIYEKQQKFQEEKFGTVALPLYAIVDPAGSMLATFPGLTRDKEEFLRFLRSAN